MRAARTRSRYAARDCAPPPPPPSGGRLIGAGGRRQINLDGISLEMQATDVGEIEYEAMHDAVMSTLTRK